MQTHGLHWRAILGWGLLFRGFLWVVMSVVLFPGVKFTVVQHSRLPSGSVLTPGQTFEAMRGLSERLAATHREVLVPASLMLLGGVLLGIRRGQKAAPPTETTQP